MHYILSQGSDKLIFKVFETQNKYRNKKDWVTRVENDLLELDMNVTFANIQKMSKTTWKNMVRSTIQQKTFKKLENKKQTHSKVKNLKYIRLEMQEYLKPHDVKNVNKEVTQNIFRIRSKVINVKMNRKNQYETYECKVCLVEDGSQEHIYECKMIWDLKQKNNMEVPKYEKILGGNVEEMIKVERIFRENMTIHDEYELKPL